MSRIRIRIVYLFFVLAFGAVVFRAFQLQIMPQQRIEVLMDKQLKKKFEVHGRRGIIVDRNGNELALSANTVSVFVDPTMIKNPRKLSLSLADILKTDSQTVYGKITQKNKRFVWIARQLDLETLKRFKESQISKTPGLGVIPEYRRFYPNGNLASQLLGFVSVDGAGLSGVEKSFDKSLKGPKNTLLISRDAWGRPIFGQQEQAQLELMSGDKLELTLDTQLQFAAERALAEAVKKHEALGGVVIVMEPYSGEILAMANYPFFNANHLDRSLLESRRNNAIANPIEPGSVVKAFVVAKALEMGKVTPQTKISGGDGQIKIGKKIIGEADDKHKFKSLSMTDLIRYSSNVGVVHLQQKIGFDAVYQIFKDVGFGKVSGVELAGESAGIFRKPKPQQLLEQATISFGQGLAVTPLQIAAAFSVLANGGYYMQPTLIKKDSDSRAVGKKVISEQTSKQLRTILEKVIEEEGTGALAKVEGFRAAGKTGTSQKVDFQKGGYKKSAYWSSFAGFVPSDKPKFVIYVMLDEPRAQGYYGGQVAAPVFSKVARAALRQSGRSVTPASFLAQTKSVPDKGPKRSNYEEESEPTLNQVREEKNSLMPDLRGLPLRKALAKFNNLKMNKVEILTTGRFVESQIPLPGESLEKNEKIYLKLR